MISGAVCQWRAMPGFHGSMEQPEECLPSLTFEVNLWMGRRASRSSGAPHLTPLTFINFTDRRERDDAAFQSYRGYPIAGPRSEEKRQKLGFEGLTSFLLLTSYSFRDRLRVLPASSIGHSRHARYPHGGAGGRVAADATSLPWEQNLAWRHCRSRPGLCRSSFQSSRG